MRLNKAFLMKLLLVNCLQTTVIKRRIKKSQKLTVGFLKASSDIVGLSHRLRIHTKLIHAQQHER